MYTTKNRESSGGRLDFHESAITLFPSRKGFGDQATAKITSTHDCNETQLQEIRNWSQCGTVILLNPHRIFYAKALTKPHSRNEISAHLQKTELKKSSFKFQLPSPPPRNLREKLVQRAARWLAGNDEALAIRKLSNDSWWIFSSFSLTHAIACHVLTR